MIGFRFLPQAEYELTEAAHYYETLEPGLGTDFLNEAQTVIGRYQENPLLGTPIDNSQRIGVFARFPYSLIYAVEPGGLLITAFAHHRRRPGYWMER